MLLEKTNRVDEAVASYNLAIKFRPSLAGNEIYALKEKKKEKKGGKKISESAFNADIVHRIIQNLSVGANLFLQVNRNR